MKKFIPILAVAIVAATGNIYAQNPYANDALRFSRTDYGSSSRFKGLGNAQISLGGDISSIGGNPAGLGMFTRSEFSITPEFNNVSSKANYLGQDTKSTKNTLNLNQAAVVWYNPIVRPKGSDLNKGVLSVVWGIGFNRNNDFGGQFNYAGTNKQSSFADDLAQQAYGTPEANLRGLPQMAYGNYLIDQTKASGAPGATPDYTPATSQINNQANSENRAGSTSELNFAGGINVSNQWYFGASIGFTNLRYVNSRTYSESGTIITDPSNPPLVPNPQLGRTYNLTFQSEQHTSGSGINARLGVIFKPVEAVRLGATFQSPTWMHMEETYDYVLDTRFSGGGGADLPVTNPIYNTDFNYNLRTPYKGSFGASVIIAPNALLTADIDYVDYSTTKLSVSDGGYDEVKASNDYIKQNYTNAINYRVGAEYRIINPLSIRAGYGYNGTPYKVDPGNLSAVKYYSAGIGYRVSQYYIDLAYQRNETNYGFSPYGLDNADAVPVASAKIARNNIFMTVGVRF